MASNQTQGKPFTGGFQLETKIRLIIQDVLSATVRKLSQFNDKVESFQDFFFTFKQRINEIEEKSHQHDQMIEKNKNSVIKFKSDSDTQIIRLEEKIEKHRIEGNQTKEEITHLTKKLATAFRQNENINNQFSKTKSKFLEFSDQLTSMKDEVSYKITKYVQETAETNTKIKVNNEQMKQQYFNVSLALEKNKEKYDEIITLNDRNINRIERNQSQIKELSETIGEKEKKIVNLNHKLDEMDTALYGKMRLTQSKIQRKISQVQENNIKIVNSVKKVDEFSKILSEIRDEGERNKRFFLKRFDDTEQRHQDYVDTKILQINHNFLQIEKASERKFKQVYESQQKFTDFINQKVQFLKMEMQTELSSKATAMMEEKSKTQQNVSSSALEAINQKINKMNMDTAKSIGKIQNLVKDFKREIHHEMDNFKDKIDVKIQKTVHSFESSSGSGVSPQFMSTLNEKLQAITDEVTLKTYNMNKEISEQNLRILGLEKLKQQTLTQFHTVSDESKNRLEDLEMQVSEKLQKMTFLVTKIRGDSIIKNQFTDKSIREIKKFNEQINTHTKMFFKLIPAFGECLNLIMCLIFDAQYQHAKIIQQNLPKESKQTQKFQNIVEGVLYEFKEKKRPGTIFYRHKQLKKTQIVKASFNAYTRVWEDIFSNDHEVHSTLLPRQFYKQSIEKFMGVKPLNPTTKGKNSFGGLKAENNSRQGSMEANDSSDSMNRSFYIRKKKNPAIKSKEQLVMVSDSIPQNHP